MVRKWFHLQVGYHPFTNHLPTSWDIQAGISLVIGRTGLVGQGESNESVANRWRIGSAMTIMFCDQSRSTLPMQ